MQPTPLQGGLRPLGCRGIDWGSPWTSMGSSFPKGGGRGEVVIKGVPQTPFLFPPDPEYRSRHLSRNRLSSDNQQNSKEATCWLHPRRLLSD